MELREAFVEELCEAIRNGASNSDVMHMLQTQLSTAVQDGKESPPFTPQECRQQVDGYGWYYTGRGWVYAPSTDFPQKHKQKPEDPCNS